MQRAAKLMMILTLGVTASCGSSSSGTVGVTGPTSGGTPSTSNAIAVGDDFFNPTATTVPVGTTVTWTFGANSGISSTT